MSDDDDDGHGDRGCHEQPPDDGAHDVLRDPVCGMKVTQGTTHRHEHAGETYRFCSVRCLEKFSRDPARYLDRGGEAPEAPAGAVFTCPMHPEVEQIGPGDCPICGMALEPRTVTAAGEDEDNPELRDMTRRFWFAAVLSAPLVVIVMLDMLPSRPISSLLSGRTRAFVELALATPVCLWSAWPFYLRAVRNLLMEEAKKEADAQERFSGLRGPAASRTKEQALSEPLSGDSAESGDDDGGAGLAHTRTDRPDMIRTRTDELEGEPEEIRLARRKLSLKLQLVVKLGRVKTRFNDIAFMVVYLAYPSVSSKCFEILRPCLEFEDVQRLAADLSVSCADSDYKLFLYFAWVAVFALPFGIPAFLFYKFNT